jgi:hypothetical protein
VTFPLYDKIAAGKQALLRSDSASVLSEVLRSIDAVPSPLSRPSSR